jgi:hypothetical protein
LNYRPHAYQACALNQLSYEPLSNLSRILPNGQLQLVRMSVYTVQFRKSNKKTAAFYCQRSTTFTQVGYGSQSFSFLRVIRTRLKTRRTFHSSIAADY